MGGAVSQGVYAFGPGQGVEIPDAGVTDHYAVDVTFTAGEAREYRKVIDFRDRKHDGGLYLYRGQVTFYGLAVGGAPIPGREHRRRLERDRQTRIVRAHMDGRPIFAFVDLDDEAVFKGRRATLFADDE